MGHTNEVSGVQLGSAFRDGIIQVENTYYKETKQPSK